MCAIKAAFGGEEKGMKRLRKKERVMEMRREQVLTNNLLPTDMVLKLFLILFFWSTIILKCTYQRNKKFESPTNLKFRPSLIIKPCLQPCIRHTINNECVAYIL